MFFFSCIIQFEPNYVFRHERLGRERERERAGRGGRKRTQETFVNYKLYFVYN